MYYIVKRVFNEAYDIAFRDLFLPEVNVVIPYIVTLANLIQQLQLMTGDVLPSNIIELLNTQIDPDDLLIRCFLVLKEDLEATEPLDFLKAVSSFGAAYAKFVRLGIINQPMYSRNLTLLETPMLQRIKRELFKAVYSSGDMTLLTLPEAADVNRVVDAEIARLKGEKRCININGRTMNVDAWALIEDEIAENLSQEDIKQYMTDQGLSNMKSAKFKLAGKKARESMIEAEYKKRSEQRMIEMIGTDIDLGLSYIEGEPTKDKIDLIKDALIELQELRKKIFTQFETMEKLKNMMRDSRVKVLPLIVKRLIYEQQDMVSKRVNEQDLETLANRAMEIIDQFTKQQGDIEESFTVSSNKVIRSFVEESLRKNEPIRFNIAVCPTRWPMRLTRESVVDRGRFFDTDPLLSDASELMLVTQQFAQKMRSVGILVEIQFTIYATDERDYIRIPTLDPWNQDNAAQQELRRSLEIFRSNLDALLQVALGDMAKPPDINLDTEGPDTLSLIDQIAKLIPGSVDPKVIKKIASRRKDGIVKQTGFYYPAITKLGTDPTQLDFRNMAIAQIATYRLQMLTAQGGQQSTKSIAIDTGEKADRTRMSLLTDDPNSARIINIYPKDRNTIPNLFRPML